MFLLANPKNNLTKNAPMLQYSITSEENDKRAHVVWHGVLNLSEQELIKKFKAGQEEVSSQGDLRQNILACLKACFPAPLTPQEISEKVKEVIEKVTVTLGRMVKKSQIERKSKGVYTAFSGQAQS